MRVSSIHKDVFSILAKVIKETPSPNRSPSFSTFKAKTRALRGYNVPSSRTGARSGGGEEMVWFQCEDCGDNLKKPKLPNHFRVCSAYKLSCIDCGQVFGQQDVESHTQCITEAEKYGPKGQGNSLNGSNTKPKKDSKPKPEVDINVGLSERPPWFCSLCNTKATSKQALLLHADGKKHRAKARAFHAAKQQPNDTAETKGSSENNAKTEAPENKDSEENNALESNKKRKLEASENDGAQNKTVGDNPAELGNGEVIQTKGAEAKGLKKAKHNATKEEAGLDSAADKDSSKKKIKWKKLITSALKSAWLHPAPRKSALLLAMAAAGENPAPFLKMALGSCCLRYGNPDGGMKLKKLRKFVLNSLKESGHTEDKNQVSEILEQKINSSSKFIVDGKHVRLATSS
ncbi:UNVERIFIED_CONTAM: UBP1-associated proteins 1C [Sesamum radiatum]|uniref:UBP1-associated proteins 1C n=1 Tax=Sesamum radiatum TaxID=300843 RepID=A0AAW2LB40_SESRA